MDSKRILITGSSGLLGTAVLPALLATGWPLRLLLRNTTPSALALLPPRVAESANVEIIEGDITDIASLQAAAKDCTHIVHMAGLVLFSSKDKNKLLKVNQEGTANLVNVALGLPSFQHFIHISSISAIATAEAEKRTGVHLQQFSGWYGYTKKLAEMEVHRGGAEGLPFSILRPSVVLGVQASARSSAGIIKMAIGRIALRPPGFLHWVDARDVATAIANLINTESKGQTYLLDSKPATWSEFYTKLRGAMGIGGFIYSIPIGLVSIGAYLAPLLSIFFPFPVPNRKQLMALLQTKQYSEKDDAPLPNAQVLSELDSTIAELTDQLRKNPFNK